MTEDDCERSGTSNRSDRATSETLVDLSEAEAATLLMQMHHANSLPNPDNNQTAAQGNFEPSGSTVRNKEKNTTTVGIRTEGSNVKGILPDGSLPISAKATAAPQVPVTTNTATYVRPARVSPYTLCRQLGHRRERCPNFPCRLCNIMGHVGRDCPARPEEHHERGKITCSHCKQQGHGRQMCPNAPCKYCNVNGYLGKDCPARAEELRNRRRAASQKANQLRRDKSKTELGIEYLEMGMSYDCSCWCARNNSRVFLRYVSQ